MDTVFLPLLRGKQYENRRSQAYAHLWAAPSAAHGNRLPAHLEKPGFRAFSAHSCPSAFRRGTPDFRFRLKHRPEMKKAAESAAV